MSTYSNQEYADILFYNGKGDGNASLATRLYHERFHPRRKIPDPRVFSNTYWADKVDNPQMKKQTSFQKKFSVNVRMVVIAGHALGLITYQIT